MNCLITGGAGFIGGHLAESLLAAGHRVTAVDDFSTGSLDNLSVIGDHAKFRLFTGDITDPQIPMEAHIVDADCIFHLAAAVGVELVVREPVRTIKTNVHGTERVLELAAKHDKRVIVASTSEVYGKSKSDFFSETDDLLIGCPTHSRWSYACSKLLDEFYTLAFCRSHRLKGTVVRFFNTVGPRQTGQYGMVVPRFVAAALSGEPLQVYGDGSQSRCFCHVADTVRALMLLMDEPASFGEIFNIGSQRQITILELAQLVIRQLGSSSAIRMIPYEEAYEAGFEDMMHRAPEIGKIKKLTNWQAVRTLEEVIADVAESIQGLK